MLQKPDLPDGRITSCLRDDYRLDMTEVAFLQLGADPDSTLYRVIANDDTPYFLKLRTRGAFAETTVEIPQFLHEQGSRRPSLPWQPRPDDCGHPWKASRSSSPHSLRAAMALKHLCGIVSGSNSVRYSGVCTRQYCRSCSASRSRARSIRRGGGTASRSSRKT